MSSRQEDEPIFDWDVFDHEVEATSDSTDCDNDTTLRLGKHGRFCYQNLGQTWQNIWLFPVILEEPSSNDKSALSAWYLRMRESLDLQCFQRDHGCWRHFLQLYMSWLLPIVIGVCSGYGVVFDLSRDWQSIEYCRNIPYMYIYTVEHTYCIYMHMSGDFFAPWISKPKRSSFLSIFDLQIDLIVFPSLSQGTFFQTKTYSKWLLSIKIKNSCRFLGIHGLWEVVTVTRHKHVTI